MTVPASDGAADADDDATTYFKRLIDSTSMFNYFSLSFLPFLSISISFYVTDFSHIQFN